MAPLAPPITRHHPHTPTAGRVYVPHARNVIRTNTAFALLNREALKGVLGGLEDWLYSQEADDADLAELKDRRRQARFFAPCVGALSVPWL